MIDLTTTQASRGLVGIKVLSVYLGLLVTSMFLLPNGYNYDTYTHSYTLTWHWSFLTQENSFYLEYYFNGNLGLAMFATVLLYMPDLISVVLTAAAIAKMAVLKKGGMAESIWNSNTVLAAQFFNLARTALALYSSLGGYFIQIIVYDPTELVRFSLNILLYFQDEIILTIISGYIVIHGWVNYRHK